MRSELAYNSIQLPVLNKSSRVNQPVAPPCE